MLLHTNPIRPCVITRRQQLIAGAERRGAARLKKDRIRNALWTLTNVIFMAFLLLLFVPAFIGLVHIFAVDVAEAGRAVRLHS